MDAALRPMPLSLAFQGLHVSILVLMDAALRHAIVVVVTFLRRVSILVLMDAALRQCLPYAVVISTQGFNPCFDGCRPATICGCIPRAQFIEFQSLF